MPRRDHVAAASCFLLAATAVVAGAALTMVHDGLSLFLSPERTSWPRHSFRWNYFIARLVNPERISAMTRSN